MTKRYLKTPEEVIDALQTGKVVSDDEGYIYKMYKGCIFWRKKEPWHIAPTICNDYGLYIEEPESLKLEVGKFYKTRRGDKVVCLCQQKEYYVHILGTCLIGYWVDKTGRALFNGIPERAETDRDVVARWEEH